MKKASFFLLVTALLSSVSLSVFMETKFAYEKKEIWPFLNPKLVEFTPSSQKGLIADLLLVWVVQRSMGNLNDTRRLNVGWLYHTLNIASLLDAKFLDIYLFGGVILPMGERKEMLIKGQALLEKGLKRYPQDWHIPFWIGMNYYQQKRYLEAARYFTIAAKKPTVSVGGIESLAVLCYYYAGEPNTAIRLLEALRQSLKSPNKKNVITRKIEWLENIIFLQNLVDTFKKKFGRLPQSLEELKEKNLTPFLPHDPFYHGYYLNKKTGRVRSYIFSTSPE